MINLTFKDGRKLDVKYPIELRDYHGNRVYYEDSNGKITGTSVQVVEMTMDEISKVVGKNVKVIK